MRKKLRIVVAAVLIILFQSNAYAWLDRGHMIIAQIAYLRLTPAAKGHVDRLLQPPPDRRGHLSICLRYWDYNAPCERTYDPITVAAWMDDIRADSLNDPYGPWHYINYNPLFDGVPERTNVGPEPVNVLDRLQWCINTLRKGTGRDKTDAEVLGFLYHLVGDVHQPLHTATRYSAALPNGDDGGNRFAVKMPPETRVRQLHFFWDSAAGLFGYEELPRPLDEAARASIRRHADEIMREYPARRDGPWREVEPHVWVEESNRIAREFAYVKIKEGEAPSKSYTEEAQKISAQRMALAGYRLAEVLNRMYVTPPTPTPTPRP